MLTELVKNFRNAIDQAKDCDEFRSITPFSIFPKGCCDLTCDLLAHYLAQYNICTYQVNGCYRDDDPNNTQNHVWLSTEDGIIIDITGDQFKNNPVFLNYGKTIHIGSEDSLHRLFVERKIDSNTPLEGVPNIRRNTLNQVYSKINKYL